MKTILISIAFLVTFNLNAQNEANNWYFGTYAALDFNSGSPVVGSSPMTTSEGTAAISDGSGNLLFYTNGVEVYDNSHTLMPNGSNLKGNISTTQSAIIVPSPSSSSQYYIFTADADAGPNGFCYSIVDMSLNSGSGDVTATKNVALTDSISEKIAAVRIPSSNEYWIVIHKYGTSQFFAYRLTSTGVASPVISSVGTVHSTTTFQNTYGQMKFNLCGDKLALALGYMNQVDLYDFDVNTGMVSNPIIIPMPDHVYGIEFSLSSDYLYVTCYDPTKALVQYNITSGIQSTIIASESPISSTDDLYGMQLATNGKIYVSRSFSSSYLGVINSPELAGFSCNYVDNAIDLDPNFMGNNGALSLPAFVASFLGNDVGCSGVQVEETENENSFQVFPNPAKDQFEISSGTIEKKNVMITDNTGRIIETFSYINRFRFGSDYPSGIYFMLVDGVGSLLVKQ